MKTDDFDFYIPDELIAQYPSQKRSDSRLLVYKKDEDLLIDSFTKNIPDFLDSGYFLVFNNSRVIPARLPVIKKDNNRPGEILIIKIRNENQAEVITDKSRKYQLNTKIILPGDKEVIVEEELADSVKLIRSNEKLFTIKYLEQNGFVPLPPYIRNKKTEKLDKKRYQTIYSKHHGSSAAPTAGLHFDKNIFNSLKNKNIDHAFVSLHVGLGTFQPIYTENIEDHKIHEENYLIEQQEALKINKAIQDNKKIIPVGTTSLRTLETAYIDGKIQAGNGVSTLYVYPSYDFKLINGLITNFHTPKSSLLVLVSALVTRNKLMEIYDYAIKKKYRFFSYGDCMLIL